MRKNKYILLLIYAITTLFFPLKRALALELIYPSLPGAPHINTSPSVEGFVVYFFVFSVIIAGSIGIISIAIAGLQILLTSGNPAGRAAAVERIKGSILGIILLMASIVLLQSINPALVTPTSPHFSNYLQNGVYYINQNDEVIPAPSEVSSVYNQAPAGYDDIIYKCTPPGPNLLVWLYPNANFRRSYSSLDGDTVSVPCGTNTRINIRSQGSFRNYQEVPGIYYYRAEDCTGLATCSLDGYNCAQVNSGDIPDFDDIQGLNNQVNSFRIVNGTDALNRFWVVLTKAYNFEGECSEPYINSTTGSICVGGQGATQTLNTDLDNSANGFNPYGIYIRKQATSYPGSHSVTLYSDHLKAKLKASDINLHYTYLGGTITYYSCVLVTPPGGGAAAPQCQYNPNGIATDCQGGAGSACAITTGSANVDNLLLPNPPDGIERGGSTENEAPNECKVDDKDADSGNRNVCINKIDAYSNFDIILYSKAQKGLERSCKIFSNGVDNTNPENNPDQNFVDLTGYNAKDKFFRNILYRMDIIPYPY